MVRGQTGFFSDPSLARNSRFALVTRSPRFRLCSPEIRKKLRLFSSLVFIVAECLPLLRCFTHSFKEKQRQAARTPNVVFVVASHYQSLQIVVLLLQACLLGSLALSRTSLLQQMHRLQQNRQFRLFASLFSCCLNEDRQCCKLLEGKVGMFFQFRYR